MNQFLITNVRRLSLQHADHPGPGEVRVLGAPLAVGRLLQGVREVHQFLQRREYLCKHPFEKMPL